MPASQHSPPVVAHETHPAGKKVRDNIQYVLCNGITIAIPANSAAAVDRTGEAATGSEEPAVNLTTEPYSTMAAATSVQAEPSEVADAALWRRLPRHIQLLAMIADSADVEAAQRYYSRGFKESRNQLIARLLDPTLTLEDAARVLGVVPATVRRYTNRGILTHHRTVGQQRRFRLSDVLAFLEFQQNNKKDFLDDTADVSEQGTAAGRADECDDRSQTCR